MISPGWIQRQRGSGRLKEAIKGLSLDEVKEEFKDLVRAGIAKDGKLQD